MREESLFSASVTDLRRHCTNPQRSRGVHLNMIKQPLGLCGWEMQIYRLADLHLNANVACMLELDASLRIKGITFLCPCIIAPEMLNHLEPKRIPEDWDTSSFPPPSPARARSRQGQDLKWKCPCLSLSMGTLPGVTSGTH